MLILKNNMENQEQILNKNEATIDLNELHTILENIEPETPEQFEMKAILERAKSILTRSH